MTPRFLKFISTAHFFFQNLTFFEIFVLAVIHPTKGLLNGCSCFSD